MALRRRHGEELRRERIVADDAAAVRVHPAEAVLRFGVAFAGRLAVELDGAHRVARHALAVLVATRVGAQLRKALERRRIDVGAGAQCESVTGTGRPEPTLAHRRPDAEAGKQL